MRTVVEAWPGSDVEVVTVICKDWRSSQRAVVTVSIQPGLSYSVTKIYS